MKKKRQNPKTISVIVPWFPTQLEEKLSREQETQIHEQLINMPEKQIAKKMKMRNLNFFLKILLQPGKSKLPKDNHPCKSAAKFLAN